tara:strand:+ start:2946 stop:3992 length:1047 start_codon:yes stop_codon:yes gene_type:complete
MRILFIGAGAVGSYLGGWLSHTNHDITIIDPWAEQVEWVRQHGIEVAGPHDTFVSRPRMLHLHESELLIREELFDCGFIAMKAYDTQWSAQFIKRFIKSEGLIISAQNCWPDKMIADIVGQERAAGLVMSNISVELYTPGKVSRPGHSLMRDLGHDVFRIGSHDGKKSNKLGEISEILDVIDSSIITENLWGERWAKLSQNCMGNPVVAMSNLGTAELAADEKCRKLQINLAREAAELGIELGYKFESFGGAKTVKWVQSKTPAIYEEVDKMIFERRNGPNRRPSMGQDVIRGRKTEILHMNGYVLDSAKKIKKALPYTEATVEKVLEIDNGRIEPDVNNVYSIIDKI